MERSEDVRLKVSPHVWDSFDHFQRSLWIVDETEARWCQLLKMYPTMNVREVYWENLNGTKYTFAKAVESFAAMLGLTASSLDVHKNKHGNQNTHKTATERDELLKYQELDRVYQKAMNISFDWSYLPKTYTSYGI